MDDAAEVATEWKIEGMANERIIATGIYFYSLSNIAQGAGISFREATYGDFDKHNFDLDVLSKAYGLDIDHSSARTGQLTINKVLGTLNIQKDRYIVFPNTYQSRMVCLQPKDSRDGATTVQE
ncbi:hypothetical protein EV175_002005 [Coemansia sp. RSA 1933]|nr:hypothetical protein EV175_002005 [Coemansia sp. RSA 1933]